MSHPIVCICITYFFVVLQQAAFQPQDFRSTVECDLPTTKIYRFNGFISHPNGEKVPVGKDNLLLRECVLKNTTFVEGLVIYAGKGIFVQLFCLSMIWD